MEARFRGRRPSPSLVISIVALFVALGGTSYAALTLPRNSVGSAQIKKGSVTAKKIKKNAVTSAKVKNRSLKAVDFASGQIPRGPAGQTGAAGAQGLPGEATAFARVGADGTLDAGTPSQNKGIVQANVQHNAGTATATSTGVGVYCFGGLGFAPRSAVVTLDAADSLPAVPSLNPTTANLVTSVAVQRGAGTLSRCDAAHVDARVEIVDPSTGGGTLTNAGFYIWFEK
jgi:hypothetical protein